MVGAASCDLFFAKLSYWNCLSTEKKNACHRKLSGSNFSYEIVVVDDCSTDGSADYVSSLCRKFGHEKIRLLQLSSIRMSPLFPSIFFPFDGPNRKVDMSP